MGDIHASVTYTEDRAAVAALLSGPSGPVARELGRRCQRVTNVARTLSPVRTGRLRSSIRWTLGKDGGGVFGEVGSDVEYAIYVHERVPFLTDALEAAGE